MKQLQSPDVLLTFGKAHNPLRLPHKTTSGRQNVFRTRQLFILLTWTHASHHNRRAQFHHLNFHKCSERGVFDFDMCFVPQLCTHFNISTSKRGLRPSFFLMACIFRHLNFHKCSGMMCLYLFHLRICFAPQKGAAFHLLSGQRALHPPP